LAQPVCLSCDGGACMLYCVQVFGKQPFESQVVFESQNWRIRWSAQVEPFDWSESPFLLLFGTSTCTSVLLQ